MAVTWTTAKYRQEIWEFWIDNNGIWKLSSHRWCKIVTTGNLIWLVTTGYLGNIASDHQINSSIAQTSSQIVQSTLQPIGFHSHQPKSCIIDTIALVTRPYYWTMEDICSFFKQMAKFVSRMNVTIDPVWQQSAVQAGSSSVMDKFVHRRNNMKQQCCASWW